MKETEGKRAPVDADPVEGDRPGEARRAQGAAPVRKSRSVAAWSLFGLTVALLVSAMVLTVEGGEGWGSVDGFFVPIGFAGVGALVAARTSSKVGWLFLAEGFAVALAIGAKEYAGRSGGPPLPGAPWAGWILTIAVSGIFSPLLLALLLFPDGRLPSARWRPVAWAAVASGAVSMACVAVSDVNFSSNFPHLADPVTIVRVASLRGIYNGALAAGPLIFLACAISLIVRLIRSRGEQRLQLKWFVYATALAATAVAVASFVLPDPSLAFGTFVPLIPIAAGIAIFKYRLYDIDVVINKTVVVAVLAAFVTAVYLGIVVGIGAVIGTRGKPNVLLSIGATAIIALAFQPLRERARRLADRVVYGERATPYEVLSEFSERMAGAYSTDDVLPRMARILGEGTGATRTEVWLRVGDRLQLAASWPERTEPEKAPLPIPAGELPSFPDAQRSIPVRHQAELLGALTLTKPPNESVTAAEEKLLSDLASQAGLMLRNVRLTAELQARLVELRASRQRLVSAQDEERRKLERNLHDGAQQQLVALSVRLRLAESIAERDPPRSKAMLADLQRETSEALENLRDLARGIYPPLLADQGLVAALESQARKATVPTEVRAEEVGRYPQEIEAAVYFCSLEALNNVAKYSQSTRADIHLAQANGTLVFEVSDDGIGFDPEATGYGTGLQGMTDRVDAVGGTLEVLSTPAHGTTVAGRIPLP